MPSIAPRLWGEKLLKSQPPKQAELKSAIYPKIPKKKVKHAND